MALYRAYGYRTLNDGDSEVVVDGKGGSYFTTEEPTDRMDTRLKTALPITHWEKNAEGKYVLGNAATHYEKVEVPAGTEIRRGIVQPQTTASGYELPGGAVEVILPENWHTDHPEWVMQDDIPLGYESGYQEHERRVARLLEEQEQQTVISDLDAKAQATFEETMDATPGSDEYHQKLKEYNALRQDREEAYQVARALRELNALEDTIDLTEGDPAYAQLGGRYGDIKGELEGYEAHHIPPQSVDQSDEVVTPDDLPAICITKADHTQTSSYAGRMRRKELPSPYSVGDTPSPLTYKQRLIAQINDGYYTDTFRNEVYEIKQKFGDRYDGAIRQAIQANRNYIKQYGNPHKKS